MLASQQQRLTISCHVESFGLKPARELITNALMCIRSNGIGILHQIMFQVSNAQCFEAAGGKRQDIQLKGQNNCVHQVYIYFCG